MRIFYLNRQEYGPHVSPADVAAQLRVRFAMDHDNDGLVADLEQLRAWGALDARQDTPRVRHASELVRKQFIYDITAAGEECERFLERVESLHEQAGSLQAQRLPAILTELRRIANALNEEEPDPAALQAAFTNPSRRWRSCARARLTSCATSRGSCTPPRRSTRTPSRPTRRRSSST